MDPNAALEEIRALCQQDWRSNLDRDDVATLLDRIEALDEWLTNGGFLPTDWQRKA